MYCKNCGNALNETDAVCAACGVNVGDGEAYCANCGNVATPDSDVCLSCGASKAPYLNGQNKLLLGLLAILAPYGIHNFMMGEKKKGIVKIVGLFCCFIGPILSLIDGIKILTGKYVIDSEKMFL